MHNCFAFALIWSYTCSLTAKQRICYYFCPFSEWERWVISRREYPELAELIDVLDFRGFFVIYCNISPRRNKKHFAQRDAWIRMQTVYVSIFHSLTAVFIYFVVWKHKTQRTTHGRETIANILHHINPIRIKHRRWIHERIEVQISMQIMPKVKTREFCWYVNAQDSSSLSPARSANKCT